MLKFRNGIHVSLDGWQSNTANCTFLPIAVSFMRAEQMYNGGTLEADTKLVRWVMKTELVGFPSFREIVHDADAYFEKLEETLADANKDCSDVISGSTDTTQVMPLVFQNAQLSHAVWVNCKQHSDDLGAEDAYKLEEFRNMYDPAHDMVLFFSHEQRLIPFTAKQKAAGVRRPLKFIKHVETRFLTKFIEMGRVYRLWPTIEALNPAEMRVSSKPDQVSHDFVVARAALAPHIEDIKDVLIGVTELLKLSPQFGSEQHFTISMTQVILSKIVKGIDSVLHRAPPAGRTPSIPVKTILSNLRHNLMQRLGPSAEYLPIGSVKRMQREKSLRFESAAEALDAATAHTWLNAGGDPTKLESTLFALLKSRLLRIADDDPAPAVGAAPVVPDLIRPDGVHDAMWRIMQDNHAAQPAAAIAQPQALSVVQSLQNALRTEVEKYCLEILAKGQAWAASCGSIFEESKYREIHWPQKLQANFPLLAVCAWLILAAFNANTMTERANSIGRLVLEHLRAGMSDSNTSDLVLAYYNYRKTRKQKSRSKNALRDILALNAGAGVQVAGVGVVGAAGGVAAGVAGGHAPAAAIVIDLDSDAASGSESTYDGDAD
jgi:hypothetical protein